MLNFWRDGEKSRPNGHAILFPFVAQLNVNINDYTTYHIMWIHLCNSHT